MGNYGVHTARQESECLPASQGPKGSGNMHALGFMTSGTVADLQAGEGVDD